MRLARPRAFELYGLGFEHKHVPELQKYTGLTRRPIFIPSVGNFRQGMLVSIPLHLDLLPGKPKAKDLEDGADGMVSERRPCERRADDCRGQEASSASSPRR